MSHFPQLSKEDEAATGADEIEVRREDQDKINKFSRLHQREIAVEEELKTKHVGPLLFSTNVRSQMLT
jgi:prefoldin subunit 4